MSPEPEPEPNCARTTPDKGRELPGKRRRSFLEETMRAPRLERSEEWKKERLMAAFSLSEWLYCSCEVGRLSGCGCWPRWRAAMMMMLGSESAICTEMQENT